MSKFKILYCIGSLAAAGGTERVLSTKASIFADKYNIEVHISTIGKNTDCFYSLSNKVSLHNLSYSYSDKAYLKIPIIRSIFIKRDLYKEYERLIRNIKPNIVIVVERGTDDFFIPNICHKLNIPVAREFHFAKKAVFSRMSIMDSILEKLTYLFTYNKTFRAFDNYDYMVLLTERDQREGGYRAKTIVIPNIVPSLVQDNEIADVYNNRTFISVGSMYDRRKGFDSIIKAWSVIASKYPDWNFEIYGDGPYSKKLELLVEEYHLVDRVKICGTTKHITDKLLHSAFYVSGAIAEGLPMVLIEAMSCGLPCVAYDCPTGPSDIITNGKDGILVPLNDLDKLSKAIEQQIIDVEMRASQSKCAREKSKQFAEDVIIPKWLAFFHEFGY